MTRCERHQTELADGGYCPACLASVALKDADEEPMATFGGYELIEEIGRGGMGVVYRARQPGLNREVALKLLPSGSLAGNEFVRRFKREAEMAARLQHPNIAQIFEAGEAEGQVFYSMELVACGNLEKYFPPGLPSPNEAARLVGLLCGAVAKAHEQGVLHRDLKPSNVLMDEVGNPKVADFGLARPLEGGNDFATMTCSLGTPAYLAPELLGEENVASPAADIYALGGILYFLLTSRPPFLSGSLAGLLEQVKAASPVPPRLLNPSVSKDLQNVCLKALHKISSKRYASAADFGEDLQRCLQGLPVTARSASLAERGWRRARRSPWLTASLAALLLVLGAGVSGVFWQATIAREHAAEVTVKASELRRRLYASDMLAASLAVQRGDAAMADGILSRWMNDPGHDDMRGFEWRHLKFLCRPTPHTLLDDRGVTLTSVAASADGSKVAVADQASKIIVHLLTNDAPLTLAWQGQEVAFIPPQLGEGFAVGNDDGFIRWGDGFSEPIATVAGQQFSLATSQPLAAIGAVPRFHWYVKGGNAAVFDWKQQRTIKEFPGDWRQVIISPDGTHVALAGATGGLQIVSLTNDAVRQLPVEAPVWALSFSPDGKQLAAGNRHAAYVWNLTSNDDRPRILPHSLTVWTTAFQADGKALLTASSDRRVRLWNLADASKQPTILAGHRNEVWCAAFAAGQDEIVSGGKDGEALLWKLPDDDEPARLMVHDRNRPPAFSPDGSLFLTQAEDDPFLHDLIKGSTTTLPPARAALGFSPDGNWILLVDSKGRLGHAGIANPAEFQLFDVPAIEGEIRFLRCLSGGRWIAHVLKDGMIVLSDASTGAVKHRIQGPPPGMRHFSIGSPEGSQLAIGGHGETSLLLHQLNNRRVRKLEPLSPYYYVAAAFSPDGKLLAAGDLAGPIRIWNVETGTLEATLAGHPEETSAVAFSPDGKTLASLGHLQGLKLWHVPTWTEVHSMDIPNAGYDLVFSPHGHRLAITLGSPHNEKVEWLMAPADGSER